VNGSATEVLAYFLGVSPGWTEAMGIAMVDGRDLRDTEIYPGAAIVNETFVRHCSVQEIRSEGGSRRRPEMGLRETAFR
jgi:hypothetical protein